MTVEVLRSADELARVVATRLVERLVEVQSDGRVPSIVLTGGTIADAVHRAVLSVPGQDSVDWSRVEVWYGDERFVPTADRDRNALQAHEALLSALPLDAERVHEMPASDGEHGDDVEKAAAAYGAEVLRVLGEDGRFDVLILGVGPDGHCASLFPGHEAVRARGVAVAVRDSPKPPPTRISLCMDTLGRSDEVWFIASGDGKAQAVHDALTSDDVMAVPASGPKGIERTVWFLDADAAARLPDGP